MSGMNVNYLTVGVGAIISMLLFVITIQLCKNSKSAKRKKSTEQKGYCSQVGYESSIQIQHSGDGEYKTISSFSPKWSIYAEHGPRVPSNRRMHGVGADYGFFKYSK